MGTKRKSAAVTPSRRGKAAPTPKTKAAPRPKARPKAAREPKAPARPKPARKAPARSKAVKVKAKAKAAPSKARKAPARPKATTRSKAPAKATTRSKAPAAKRPTAAEREAERKRLARNERARELRAARKAEEAAAAAEAERQREERNRKARERRAKAKAEEAAAAAAEEAKKAKRRERDRKRREAKKTPQQKAKGRAKAAKAKAKAAGLKAAPYLVDMMVWAAAASSGVERDHAYPSGHLDADIFWQLSSAQSVAEAEVSLAQAGDEINDREAAFWDRDNLYWSVEMRFMIRRDIQHLYQLEGEDVRYAVVSYDGAASKVGGGPNHEEWEIPLRTGWMRSSTSHSGASGFALVSQTAIETMGAGAEALIPDYDDVDELWLDSVKLFLHYAPDGVRPESQRTKTKGSTVTKGTRP